jgi:hypothetical protein
MYIAGSFRPIGRNAVAISFFVFNFLRITERCWWIGNSICSYGKDFPGLFWPEHS